MYDVKLDPNGIYFAYLRKSRDDLEAEKNGAEDVLARHEYILKQLAIRLGIKIAKWYREVVSGETISGRPEMKNLLSDVETIHPTGVLTVEVERLSRGNSQDQGRVMDTFKYSGTFIITPMQIYDLTQESDEEWMDFGLLRSRMEYRTIKRRLISGRNTSAMQGKFIGSIPPYGWKREKLKGEKGYTLVPDDEQIEVVKMIFTLMTEGNEYTDGSVGIHKTADILNDLNITPPRGEVWTREVVARVVKNPVHIGMLRIGYRKQVATVINGVKQVSHPKNNDCLVVPARWEGVISKEAFDQVSARLKAHTSPHTCKRQNPLSGLVYCGVCGKPMQRNGKHSSVPYDVLLCTTSKCPTVASYLPVVEEKLLSSLEQILENYKLELDGTMVPDDGALKLAESQLKNASSQASTLQKQLDKIHICFEQDIYDMDTFLERSHAVKSDLEQCKEEMKEAQRRIEEIKLSGDQRKTFIPRFEGILDSYRHAEDPEQKNALLKELISRIDYTKTDRGSSTNLDSFELDIHLRIMP